MIGPNVKPKSAAERTMNLVDHCLRKAPHRRRQWAETAAASATRRFRRLYRAYLCMHCGSWHITAWRGKRKL